MIEIRKTRPTEVQVLMDIFEQAKRIMRKNGNMLQWSGNYPSPEMITADIKKGNSYVCSDSGGEIVGTFAFIRGNDPTYTHIYEGEWLENTLPYGVIHRLASTENSRGVADACLQWCYKQIPNLRVDTHRHNRILQHILKKHGFQYCGIIFLANGDERLAFQKTADAVPSPINSETDSNNMTQIKIKRVYEAPDASDGYRILVDRLWPRGMKKEQLKYDAWEKEITPSPELRKWFHQDPAEHWEGFAAMYRKELEGSEAVRRFVGCIERYDVVTLLYASKEPEHNHARILQQFLKDRQKSRINKI